MGQNLSVDELKEEGWRVVTHPIVSPVCSKAEGHFARAFNMLEQDEDAIVFNRELPIRILLERDKVFKKVEGLFSAYLKKRGAFGRRSALITGGMFEGWIASGGRYPDHFLMARPTVRHLESEDLDKIKGRLAINPTASVPRLVNQEAWTREYLIHCCGAKESSLPVFPSSGLNPSR